MSLIQNSIKDRVVKELEFYHSFKLDRRKVWAVHMLQDELWLEHAINYINSNKIGLIDYFNECIDDDVYHILVNQIKKTGHNILIKSSNAFESPFGFHPLTNIAIWERHSMPNQNIYDGNKESNFVKPFSPWNETRNITAHYKKNIYILSVRRQTPIRNSLFDKINEYKKEWSNTVRYSKYDEFSQTAKSKKTTNDIIQEYKNAFISFVVETIYDGTYDKNLNYSINLTEKTLFAYSTKTIPIFFGCKHLIKSLKQMGFYTFDDIFSIDIDDIDTFDEKRQYEYIKCLDRVDKMTFNEVFGLYCDLESKIKHNYDLINYLFELNHAIEHKYDTILRFN